MAPFLLVAALAASAPECNLGNVTRLLTPGSRELRAYVSHVYGEERDEEAAHARDADFAARLECCVDVLYQPLLPRELARCTWSRVGTVYGSVYRLQNYFIQPRNSVWVYRYDRPGCPHARTNNGTALPVPPPSARVHDHSAEWVEVTHTFTGHYAERSGLFFMYRAAGSGLWYRLGRTLEVRTHEQAMAMAGNATDWEQVHAWLLARGYRSLVVTHKCEHWGAAWVWEVVHVPGILHEPPPPAQRATALTSARLAQRFLAETCLVRFARGYGSRREPCSCCAWAAAKPTWCAAGSAFTVSFARGEAPQPGGVLNVGGVLPIIVGAGASREPRGALLGAPNASEARGADRTASRAARPPREGGAGRSKRRGPRPALAHRRLQLGLSDLVRDPASFSRAGGGAPKEPDTIHFYHMTCAEAAQPAPPAQPALGAPTTRQLAAGWSARRQSGRAGHRGARTVTGGRR